MQGGNIFALVWKAFLYTYQNIKKDNLYAYDLRLSVILNANYIILYLWNCELQSDVSGPQGGVDAKEGSENFKKLIEDSECSNTNSDSSFTEVNTVVYTNWLAATLLASRGFVFERAGGLKKA